jgi:hypothetical protein
MHLDAEECEGDASDEGTARQEDEGGQHRAAVALGETTSPPPAMSARHSGPKILPTPFIPWASPIARALSCTG